MKQIIFITLVFCATSLHAQFRRPYFNTISIENGLPEGFVVNSFQDRLGYLWFGTQNGLVRYDGYKTESYSMPDDEGKPIYTASIMNLFEDKRGTLWAGVMDNGYFKYDRQKNVFVKAKIINAPLYNTPLINGSKFLYDKKNDLGWGIIFDHKTNDWVVRVWDLAHGTVESFSSVNKGKHLIAPGRNSGDIMIDSSGNTWLATDSLLSIYDNTSGSFKPWFSLPSDMNKIMFNYIAQDPVNKDLFWISTLSIDSNRDANKARIIQLNIKTKDYKTYNHIASDPNSISGTCSEIYIDPMKRMFFYTDHGISMFNRSTGKFTNYILTVPGAPAKDAIQITSVTTDKDGNLWIGGIFKGLFFLNTTTALATFYTHTAAGSLPDFRFGINKIFLDRSGVLWVSIPYSGIAWLDVKRSYFNPVTINAPAKDGDKNSGTTAKNILGMYNDSIYFVGDDKNIFTWNQISHAFKNITPGDGKQVVVATDVITDKEGLIWMATDGAGLFCYNPITKTTKNYRNDPKDSFSIATNNINRIAEDNDGNLWIGTSDQGLNSLNKKTGKFTRYPFINNDATVKANNVLDDRTVNSLLCDKDGIIWIGTNLGSLNRFDSKKGKFTSYLDNKEGFECIISLYEDSHNRLWAGSYLSGVFLINKDSGFLKHLTERNGLSSNDIGGITGDKKGNIWLATSHGLSKLDPVTNQITNYTAINGLPAVLTSGIYKDSKGLFYVPIKNGVIPFDPDNMEENKIPPEVVIETIKYPAAANTVNNSDTVLFTDGRQELSLKYNENKISFQYVALHFSNPSLNQYAYQLEGYDKQWIPAGTERTVTYTNLSPGHYTFHVKAANSDGVWNESGASFSFTILPPWWQTWWAYLLYTVAFLAAVFSFVAYRSAALRRQNKILEEKVELRTTQLQNSIADLKSTQSQLIQSEKMASLGELTAGIAHEIQNPLNFVNNFSEVNSEMIDELKIELATGNLQLANEIADDIKSNEQKINHHGKRADAIVKSMLQHSRQSSGKKEPADINALCDEYLRLSYHGLRAKDKNFNAEIKTGFDPSIGKINLVSQDIGRVLLNLFNNAFYACAERSRSTANQQKSENLISYKPLVSVTTRKSESSVLISVGDNGVGIPDLIKEKIFQPFFTTKPTGSGTGLGLSLSYDIVKAHGGEIKVESKEGEGTTFIIELASK